MKAKVVFETVGDSKKESKERDEQMLALLAELGNGRVEDTSIEFGDKFVLPKEFDGRLDDAIQFLIDYHKEQDSRQEFRRTFMRRPWDGAVALRRALYKMFGTVGARKSAPAEPEMGDLFGALFGGMPSRPLPEQVITIKTGVNEEVQVPFGSEINFPLLEAELDVQSTFHPEYGPVFMLVVTCPKKYAHHVEGLFKAVEAECNEHSIYKGKAIDGQFQADFIDTSVVDPNKLVYSEALTRQLEAKLWGPMRHTETYRQRGLSLKRTVLLKGRYGNGKTMTATRAMQIAEENGWTSILCRPGRDDFDSVMMTARLHQPCLVVFEDVDTISKRSEDDDGIKRLLDMFDGIKAKNTEIMVVFTTNHPDDIHKAMWRPGRFDSVVELGEIDRWATERVVKAYCEEDMRDDLINYDAVYEAMKGFSPAFAVGAVESAIDHAISRTGGAPDKITTEDLVGSAEALRPQWEQMEDAHEGETTPYLEEAFATALAENLEIGINGQLQLRNGVSVNAT